jgi:hypothetical protein
MAMNGLDMIGQPAVLERGFAGTGTVVTIDTGGCWKGVLLGCGRLGVF